MASNTVEQIFVELLLNAKGYNKDADEAVKKSEKLEKGLGGTEKQAVKTDKSIANFTTGLGKAVKGVAGFAAVIAAGTGLLKLADEARKANDELNFLSKNLGMSSGEVKAWQGAAAAMGGSAQGMAGDMKGLNSSMNDFAMTGESSMLPMFNTLGVSMVDAQGKVRGTNDVMLDLADSMSKMDREQAFLMGQKLGFDEGTINTLLQGRDAMQEMVDYHKQMYTSNKQELEASRKLSENQAKLGAHWDSMKLMMGNAIIPLLVKLSNVALRFFEFLQRHQKTVKTVFEGMAIFLGMLVVPLLGKALVAALLFMAPFAPFILTVGLLAAAFIGLYQDYKTWAEGGKSLFNWGAFSGYIDNAKISTENLGKGFLHLIGDYNSWAEVAEDGKSWLKLKGFIDENGVSLKTLRAGFIDLAGDIVKYAIPTLKGYAEILQKLVNGDFKGAAWQSAQMFQNLGDKIIQGGKDIWNRATGAIDVATGQQVGTLSNSAAGTMPSNPSTAPSKAPLKNTNDAPSKFIAQYWGMAVEIGKKLNVPPELIIAQLAEETGWGKSPVGDFNLGNIKKGSNWKGPTKRGYDKTEKSWADYRSYSSPEEFGEDYYNVVGKQKNFSAVRGSRTPQEFFGRLKSAGYATDEDYVKKNTDVYNSVMRRLSPTQPQAMKQGAGVNFSQLKHKQGNTSFDGRSVTESIGGGSTEQGTMLLAKAMQDALGSGLYHFGAFNDVYHQRHSPNSKHTKGLAFDMTLASNGQKATEAQGKKLAAAAIAQIEAKLAEAGIKRGQYKILDEYNKPSSKATAGHIHVEFTDKNAAAAYSKSSANAISKGAAQAQATMPKNQIPASIAKPANTTNSNKVDVKVNKIEVNTTASTLTGTMEDAIKGLNNNNLYQFPIGLNT